MTNFKLILIAVHGLRDKNKIDSKHCRPNAMPFLQQLLDGN